MIVKNDVFDSVLNEGCETRREMKMFVPTVIEETYNGCSQVPLKVKHLTDRKIFIVGEITDTTSDDFVSEFIYFSKEDKPVDIYINSVGGSVNAGLVIYDMIQSCIDRFKINMYCIGRAASMGALLLAAGQKGRRFILPHSTVMIHEPLIDGGIGGSATSIKKTADSILETKKITNGILAKHTGKTLKEINEATAFDNYMNAEEAIAFGICDEIKNII